MDNSILGKIQQSDVKDKQEFTEPIPKRKQSSIYRDRTIWRAKKRRALVMAARLKAAGKSSRSYRMMNCAETIISDVCPKCETRYLTEVTFCRDRLCPLCSWRRARRLSHRLSEIVTICESEKPSRYIMLTLAVRNVPWVALNSEIRRLMLAWDRFGKRIKRAETVTGWARSLEITRYKNNGNAHPHLHVLLQVPPEYFDKQSEMYLAHRQADLVQQWRDCLGADYEPTVDIRAVKQEERNLTAAVRGITKYIAKGGDVEGLTDEEFTHYIEAMNHVRSWSTGGRMKINEEEIDSALDRDGDEKRTPGVCANCGDVLQEMREVWNPESMEYAVKVDVDYNGRNSQNKSERENDKENIDMRHKPKIVNVNIYNTGAGNIYVDGGLYREGETKNA